MCDNRCGCNRWDNFGEEAFVEAEELINWTSRNRCRENRCARQFVNCLRDSRRDDRCGCNRCNRCGCNRCN